MGLVLNEVVALKTGFIALGPLLPVFVLQGVLSLLFLVAYRKGESAAEAA
jgi:hypothetical protein